MRRVATDEQADLTCHRRKEVRRLDPAGDQRRHAPQRRLLAREPGQLVPQVRVGLSTRLVGAQPVLDVGEGHDGAGPFGVSSGTET